MPRSLHTLVPALMALIGLMATPALARAQVGLSMRLPGDPTIGVPIQVSRRLLVEPFLAVSRSTDRREQRVEEADGSDPASGRSMALTMFSPGVSVYWMLGHRALQGLVGARLSVESGSIDSDYTFQSSSTYRTEGDFSSWTLGLVAGLQTMVSDRLSLAGELLWSRTSVSETSEEASLESGYYDRTTTDTERRLSRLSTQVVLRWYPWKPLPREE